MGAKLAPKERPAAAVRILAIARQQGQPERKLQDLPVNGKKRGPDQLLVFAVTAGEMRWVTQLLQ